MKSILFRALAVCFLCLPANLFALHWRVWTVTDTRHVLRSEAPEENVAATLSAARNEWVSFQILARSELPVQGIQVIAGELNGPDGAILPVSSARLYRQHQVYLEVGTSCNDAFQPDWYPDPLIPFHHSIPDNIPAEIQFQATPFDLPPGETHGFWVDIYVPADCKPGPYQGEYHVTADGVDSVAIPVELTVWDFALPPTPTLVTEFGSPTGRLENFQCWRDGGYTGPEPSIWPQIEEQCLQLVSEHRINAMPREELLHPQAQSDGSFRFSSAQVAALRSFVDRYHVNAIRVPHPSKVVSDPVAEKDKLHSWLRAFDRAAIELDRSHIVFYTYLKDEPNTLEAYRYVQQWGGALRQADSVVKVLVVEQTWPQQENGAWGDLYGAVDIWSPKSSLFRPESAAVRQAVGETIWTYTATCPGSQPTPRWHIDNPLLNYRVPGWMAWRDGMKGLLYWGEMSYCSRVDDAWIEAPYHGADDRSEAIQTGIYHGEGCLVYPTRTIGYDGIVPTIRLKALRDAIEDYEYLALLDRLGKAEQAHAIVRGLSPSWSEWNKSPLAYEIARAELAALIVDASNRIPRLIWSRYH